MQAGLVQAGVLLQAARASTRVLRPPVVTNPHTHSHTHTRTRTHTHTHTHTHAHTHLWSVGGSSRLSENYTPRTRGVLPEEHTRCVAPFLARVTREELGAASRCADAGHQAGIPAWWLLAGGRGRTNLSRDRATGCAALQRRAILRAIARKIGPSAGRRATG